MDSFFNNQSTSEFDFARLLPQLKDAHMVRQAQRDPVAKEAAALAKRYGGGELL